MLNLVLLCGGPSKERDISLNSVRSVFDHFRTMPGIGLKVIFFDESLNRYYIDEKFLYSNTTSDFEFMLTENEMISEEEFTEILRSNDLVFPVMHGKYGEDGQIQAFLQERNIPFIASPAEACRKMYNKKNADTQLLQANGLRTIPKIYINNGDDISAKVTAFMKDNGFSEAVIKPVEGGSSIGVTIARSIDEAVSAAKESLPVYGELVVEQLCRGKEFTVIILESGGKTAALMPTEIELLDKDGNSMEGELFDKRKKYLSTTETHYYCPARFDHHKIDEIRDTATKLFKLVGARDFLRIDGWLLDDDSIYFSDFNPISGMEQNSFIFQQAAAVGLRHKDLLSLILKNACDRYNISYSVPDEDIDSKKRLNLILGGLTSERQVSLMSGTNVWLKLLNSAKYHPVPYILFEEDGEMTVYEVPYAAALKHTTEEIYDYIKGRTADYVAYTAELKKQISAQLDLAGIARAEDITPERMTIDQFISMTKGMNADVFIGLHGGYGENGTLQKKLEDAGLNFNGSGSVAAKLCMNKFETGKTITALNLEGVRSCKKILMGKSDVENILNDPEGQWNELSKTLGGKSIVIKPNGDGCSTGIVILHSADDLKKYIELLEEGYPFIPENTFADQPEKIQLPKTISDMLFEEYIATEELVVTDKDVTSKGGGDWVELTVGVLAKKGQYHSLNPSITVADNAVLSLEEKFQGGTGINITPPPANIISDKLLGLIKKAMENVAKACGVKDYCRIDIFANNKTNEIIIIELNTLPGLSPSTVLFQQGAKEVPPLYPMELLEKIIEE
ncbi:MAG: hypothetical protein J6L99_00475 [Ruminococcus sp.]|nr:hypothetical protein [Ruminococcus sp.]